MSGSQDTGPVNIDLSLLGTPLREIPEAIFNRLRREKGDLLRTQFQGLDVIVPMIVRVSANTWNSIRFLCTDKPYIPERIPEFALSVPPLARTILDSLFTLVLLFDDPGPNTRWYFASGWREASNSHRRLVERHGTDPRWKSWLEEHKTTYVDGWELDAKITDDEKAHPNNRISWWPNPGKMVSKTNFRDPKRQSFLKFLNDWYYTNLSGDSHLSMLGLARRGGILWGSDGSGHQPDVLMRYRSSCAVDSMALFVALLSEISAELTFTHEQERLKQLWGHLMILEQTRDLYTSRCDKWFPTAG